MAVQDPRYIAPGVPRISNAFVKNGAGVFYKDPENGSDKIDPILRGLIEKLALQEAQGIETLQRNIEDILKTDDALKKLIVDWMVHFGSLTHQLLLEESRADPKQPKYSLPVLSKRGLVRLSNLSSEDIFNEELNPSERLRVLDPNMYGILFWSASSPSYTKAFRSDKTLRLIGRNPFDLFKSITIIGSDFTRRVLIKQNESYELEDKIK